MQAWDTFFEIKHACKEKQHQPEVIQELLNKLLNDVKIISEELAEFINSPSWNRPAIYYDDDEDYTIAITPDLATEEPVNSLSMGDEHLDTIPATESDEVIKSSVEDLVPIPSESEGCIHLLNLCDQFTFPPAIGVDFCHEGVLRRGTWSITYLHRETVLSPGQNVNLPFEDDQSPLLANVVWIFLPFLTYPVTPPYLLLGE
ncbi:hypothetical protein Tco_0446741 [Tanacetum coccineum]